MAHYRRFIYRKPPDGLLEISERVFVFDCCFTTEIMEENQFKTYVEGIIGQLQESIPDASYMAFNIREGDYQTLLDKILSNYDVTIIDYPRQYKNCPVLTVEMIHHFLRTSENWLSLGQRNVLLMHCERGGWPVLAFMLAGLLIYQKQYNAEQRTLDMIYRQAPRELLNLICPLNPLPSQLRYLQYISRRNVSADWPPVDRSLILDCVILRMIPIMDGSGGCRPIFRIYGQNAHTATDRSSKLLFSTPKESKHVRRFNQAQCELVKIDINCHVQGDVVLECITLDDDLIKEKMMFRVMFNTALIRSNILMLNRDEIDILWNVKEQFPNGFRSEIIFSDLDSASSMRTQSLPVTWDKAGLPMEAFSKVQEIFSNVDFICSKPDVALDIIHNLAASSIPKKIDVVCSTKRQLSDSDLVHKAKDLEQLESLSQKGAKEAKVVGGLSMGGAEGMTNSMSVEEMMKHAESGKDVRGPSVEIELEVLQADPQRSSEQEGDSTKEVGNLEDVSPQSFSEKLAGGFSSQVTGGKKSNEMAKEILVTQNISEAGAEVMSNYVETDRGSRSSVAKIQELFSTKSAKETACLPNTTVAKIEESDRVARSSAAEIQESPAYPQIFAEDRDKQVDIITSKGETETLPIQTMNIAETKEMSEPVELERGASCSTAEVGEPQLATQKSSESRLVLRTSPKGSMSNPTSYCNSLQGSPVPLSRYHSAPSVLGISALLNDHFAPEINCSNAVTLSLRHAVSPSFPISDKDMLCSPGSTMRKSPTPHLKENRSEAMNILQSLVTSRSQTLPGKVTPPSPRPQPMPSTLAPKLNDCTPRVPPPPPPPPYAISSTKAMSSFMQHENSSAVPQLPLSLPGSELATYYSCSSSVPEPPSSQSFAQQGTQHAAPTSLVPAPPPPPPALIAKHSVPDITPHFPPDSSRVPKPPPSPPLHLMLKESMPVINRHNPPVPPPPAPSLLSKSGSASFTPPPTPPLGAKGRMQSRSTPRNQLQSKKSNLKPYHWLKLTRAVQGSLWAEAQKPEEASQTPEINMSELESLFAASVPNSDRLSTVQRSASRTSGPKSEKVNLIELRRAYNCEIMLTKVKVPLHELKTSILTLDDSALDVDQVENLIKFCPRKEEIDLLKNFKGDEKNLGKCEQFFLELMKVPCVESKLRVFAFKIQFHSQVSDLKKDLNVINSACEEVRNSVKLKRIMQTILSLGNALNQGTARGSAVGFRLDSLLKLTDTRSRNNKMTLMHYLCKVLCEKLPELLNFPEDLLNLEAATKIQLKYLAEEMQAVSRGLEKVIQELTLSQNDGSVSDSFCKALMKFLPLAEGEVRSLASLYARVGRDADALSLYFGEDPARVPFEQVVSTLHNFVRMFIRAHDENGKQIELEKKKAQKEEDEKAKLDSSQNQKVAITSNLQDHLVK